MYIVPGMNFYIKLHVLGAVPVRKKSEVLD